MQGVWEPRRNDGGDRHILNERASEVEARQLFQEREVLHDERTIEAERPTQGFDVSFVAVSGTSRYVGSPVRCWRKKISVMTPNTVPATCHNLFARKRFTLACSPRQAFWQMRLRNRPSFGVGCHRGPLDAPETIVLKKAFNW